MYWSGFRLVRVSGPVRSGNSYAQSGLKLLRNVKNMMEISLISEAFSEYMNFRLIANSRNIVPDSQDSFPTQNFTVDTFGQANSIDKVNFPVPHCQNCRPCYIIHAMNTC